MSAPTLDELIADFKGLPFSGHAHAIGHLCIQWNHLERTLDIALVLLSGMENPNISAAILHNADMRDKWKMLDAIGFTVRPNDEWYERLRAIINKSDNDLRNERNRMIHDQWSEAEAEIIRRTSMAKIVKEQARKLALKTYDEKPVSEDEIWELVVSIAAQSGYLTELLVDYLNL